MHSSGFSEIILMIGIKKWVKVIVWDFEGKFVFYSNWGTGGPLLLLTCFTVMSLLFDVKCNAIIQRHAWF